MSAAVLVSAGEASGDLYASELVKAMVKVRPDLKFFGCAGPRMESAGVEPVVHSSSLAVVEVSGEAISAYGVVDAEPVEHNGMKNRLFRIRSMVEKPKPSEAPSNLAIIGRYVLTPEIFPSIESITPGSGGELQLTDGLRHLLRNRPVYGLKFEGTRYDAGDKLGFLKATVEFALRRHDLGGPFREYLQTLSF